MLLLRGTLMGHRFFYCISVSSLTALFVFMSPPCADAKPFRVGSINDESPAQEVAKFLPIAAYLTEHLKDEGYDVAKVIVAQDIKEMAEFYRQEKVDVYIDSPFPVVAVARLSNSRPVLRRWKKGIAEYRSVLFAAKESGISSLDDLKGKVVGFEDRYSSSGYLLPKLSLSNKGFRLVEVANQYSKVAEDVIGYTFTGSDESIMVWTNLGKVAAGAVSDRDFKKWGKRNKDKYLTLLITDPIPRHIVSVRDGLPDSVIEKIKQILIDMEKLDSGKKTLKKFERTTRFDEIPPGALEPIFKADTFFQQELQ